MNLFYRLFGDYFTVTELILTKDGKEIERERDARIFLNDPALWAILLLLGLMGVFFVLLVVWMDPHWILSYPLMLAALTSIVWMPWFFFASFSTLVREDRLLARQILGGRRFFTNTRVLDIPGITHRAFYPNNQHTIFSDDKEGEEFVLTSYVKQDLDDYEGLGVDADENGNPVDVSDHNKAINEKRRQKAEKRRKRIEELKAQGLSDVDAELKELEEEYDEEKIPRLEQLVVLKILFKLPVFTLPQLLNEQFFTAFHHHDLDNGYDAISDVVRKQILELVLGHADAVLQKYSMTTLNGDVARVNRALTARIAPLLLRLPVQVEAVIVDSTNDMPGQAGYQTQNARRQQATLKSEADQQVARADRNARVVQAEENEAAFAREQAARAENARNEAAALKEVKKSEKAAAEARVQDLVVRMKAIKDHEAEFTLAMFESLSAEQQTEFLTEVAKNLNPDLTNATLVSLGNLVELFPIQRIVFALGQLLQKKLGVTQETGATDTTTTP